MPFSYFFKSCVLSLTCNLCLKNPVRIFITSITASFALLSLANGQDVMPLEKRLELAHEALLENRREEIPYLGKIYDFTPEQPNFPSPSSVPTPAPWESKDFPWRRNVQVLIFWIGQPASPTNPIANNSSAWNPNWLDDFGGVDDPLERNGFFPKKFAPKINPFYVALPYNDLDDTGFHKEEAAEVIPWYWRKARSKYDSLCNNRWLALHFKERICYAQWKDVGPKYADDWSYVFKGKFKAREKGDQARILISPAIRDYLQVPQGEEISWKFLENYEIPKGPWEPWIELDAEDTKDPTTPSAPLDSSFEE